MPDAALDDPVRIFAREFPGIRTGIRMRRAVGVAFQGKGGRRDYRGFGKPLLQSVILRLAFRQPKPPTIVMDRDADMIGVVEGRRAASERGIVEVPLRRSELPDEPGKIAPVFVVACPAAFRGEIELVPPLELRAGRQRNLAGFLAADQI